MAELAGHRALVADLPEQPLYQLLAAGRVGRREASGLPGEIEQDRARLEHADRRRAIGRRRVVVDDRRYLRVRLIDRNSGVNWSPWPSRISRVS
jgi:hypothetical protein